MGLNINLFGIPPRRINVVIKIQMSVFIKIEFKFIMVACDVFSL